MQSFEFSFFILSLVLSSFHGKLVNGQDFNFASGKLDGNSLTSLKSAVVDSTGTLTLDASTGDAQAFYKSPFTLRNTISTSANSFSTFFSFSSNATNGNGTIAFVLTPDDALTGGVATARKTFTLEFNASCGTGVVYNGSAYYGGPGFPGRGDWGRGGGRGFYGGLGGFQVIEYANSTSITSQAPGGYGPNWDGTPADGPYFCSQQPPPAPTSPIFQYQVAVQYNASTDIVWVGSPSCGSGLARTSQFAAYDLSSLLTAPVYVGFLVSNGGIFNISQWNFTSNSTTNSALSLALSSVVSSTPGSSSGDDGSSDNGDGRGHGDMKISKGYVIAFSILGAAIGIAAVLVVCCCCVRRRRVTSGRFVGKSVGTIPESAVVFDARKPHAPAAKVVLAERDTTPLNAHHNSAFQASTGGATWLQPVAPR